MTPDIDSKERFFLQVVMTKKGTVMQQWTINDRETSNSVVCRIYRGRENLIKPILNLLNETEGYLK